VNQQDAEKVRQDRSRLIEILNVPSEGTPPGSIRLRPCWTAFLSILQERFLVFQNVQTSEFPAHTQSFSTND